MKIFLDEDKIPKRWYNIQADMPNPVHPPMHPALKRPVEPQDLEPIFPKSLIEQEMSKERWIEIPDEVLDVYRIWRPSPLVRAINLEKALGTPARIYYKNESVSPAGSHKVNTSVPQAYYNKKEGIERLTTETGAGQWGSALSFAANKFGLELTVYMVKVSYYQKPYRRVLMNLWGAQVFPSPTDRTEAGRKILAEDPDNNGSLGIAISEAVEDAVKNENTKYALGSVLNHVLLHQTVTGLETIEQLKLVGEKLPDVVLGCVGGGSNYAGLAFPFIPYKLNGEKKDMRFIAVEPAACPTLTKGLYKYDFGDVAGLTPLMMMHTLGHKFMPPPIHAGGLRYHGMAPLISRLVEDKIIEAVSYKQNEVFKSAQLFAQTEGIVPAPETAHAVHGAIQEALKAKEEGKEKVIVFLFSGHGHFDMASYEAFLEGKLEDFELTEEHIKEFIKDLPDV